MGDVPQTLKKFEVFSLWLSQQVDRLIYGSDSDYVLRRTDRIEVDEVTGAKRRRGEGAVGVGGKVYGGRVKRRALGEFVNPDQDGDANDYDENEWDKDEDEDMADSQSVTSSTVSPTGSSSAQSDLNDMFEFENESNSNGNSNGDSNLSGLSKGKSKSESKSESESKSNSKKAAKEVDVDVDKAVDKAEGSVVSDTDPSPDKSKAAAKAKKAALPPPTKNPISSFFGAATGAGSSTFKSTAVRTNTNTDTATTTKPKTKTKAKVELPPRPRSRSNSYSSPLKQAPVKAAKSQTPSQKWNSPFTGNGGSGSGIDVNDGENSKKVSSLAIKEGKSLVEEALDDDDVDDDVNVRRRSKASSRAIADSDSDSDSDSHNNSHCNSNSNSNSNNNTPTKQSTTPSDPYASPSQRNLFGQRPKHRFNSPGHSASGTPLRSPMRSPVDVAKSFGQAGMMDYLDDDDAETTTRGQKADQKTVSFDKLEDRMRRMKNSSTFSEAFSAADKATKSQSKTATARATATAATTTTTAKRRNPYAKTNKKTFKTNKTLKKFSFVSNSNSNSSNFAGGLKNLGNTCYINSVLQVSLTQFPLALRKTRMRATTKLTLFPQFVFAPSSLRSPSSPSPTFSPTSRPARSRPSRTWMSISHCIMRSRKLRGRGRRRAREASTRATPRRI